MTDDSLNPASQIPAPSAEENGPWNSATPIPEDEHGPWDSEVPVAEDASPPEPDNTALKQYFQKNLENFHAPMALPPQTAQGDNLGVPKPNDQVMPRVAKSFAEAVEAGWQMSVSGLLDRKKMPDVVLGEDPGTFYNIASQAGTLVGDLPAMLAGEAVGVSVGTAAGTSLAPGPGTAVGAIGGAIVGTGYAFGLPAGMRRIMIDSYQKGEIKSAKEFLERASAAFIDTAKGFYTGAATAGVGRFIGGQAVARGLGPVSSTVAAKAAEVATMTSVAAGLEGHLPNAKDFTDAAVLVGGLSFVHGVQGKIEQIYAETGMTPHQVVERADSDPVFKQELLLGPDLPKGLTPEAQLELGLQPHAQGELPLEQKEATLAIEIPESGKTEKSDYKQIRLEAAKKLDPVAFQALDKMEKELIELGKQSESLTKKQVENSKQIEAGMQLEEIQKRLSNTDDLTMLEQKSLAEEEASIRSKYGDDATKFADLGRSIENQKSEIAKRVERIQGNETVKARVAKAYSEAQQSIPSERRTLDMEKSALNELPPGSSKDFSTPETEMHLADPNQMELPLQDQFDFNLHQAMENHPETRKASAKIERDTHLSSGEQAMLDMIGDPAEAEKSPPILSEAASDKFRKDFIDRFHMILARQKKLAGNRELSPLEDPHVLALKANSYTGLVEHMLKFGIPDFKDPLKVTTRGLDQILGDVGTKEGRAHVQRLKAYMIAERGLEIVNAGKNPGKKFNVELAKQTVAEGSKEFNKQAKELVDFQNKLAKYVKDSGFLSNEQYQAMIESNKKYVPWNRIDPELPAELQKGKSKSKPFHELKGSDKDLRDPFETIVRNVDFLTRTAEKNRAISAFVNLNMKAPEGERFIEPITDEKAKVSDDPLEQIADNVKNSTPIKTKDAYTISRMKDGVRESYRVDKDIYEAYEALGANAQAVGFLSKFARAITKIKRGSITINPAFPVKNIIRDYQTSGSFMEGGAITAKEYIDALKAINEKNEVWQMYLRSGGAHSTWIESDQSYSERYLRELNEKTGFFDTAWSTVKTGVDKLAAFGEIAEEATRVAAFMRKAGKSPTAESLAAGGVASKESTVDFSRVGAKMAAFRAITAFQGAQIQGADRYFRAFKEDIERGQKVYSNSEAEGAERVMEALKAGSGTIKRSFLLTTLPVVALWAANRNDKRVDDLPQYQKDTNFIIPTDRWVVRDANEAAALPDYLVRKNEKGETEVNEGVVLRIPKSQEGGLIFGATIERMLDTAFKDNKKAGDDFAKTVLEAFIPNLVPDVVLPAAETAMNKSLWTGNKLVPFHLEGQLPEHIYTEYTSQTAKVVGKLVGKVPSFTLASEDFNPKLHNPFNPIVVDNWMKSWGGPMGEYAINLLDKGLEKSGATDEKAEGPQGTWSDTPFFKAFVIRYPSMGLQPIQDFYKIAEDADRVGKTAESLQKAGKLQELQELIEAEPALFLMKGSLSQARASMGKMQQAANAIKYDQGMTPLERRHLLDGIYFQISGIAKTMNTQMEEAKKQSKDMKVK